MVLRGGLPDARARARAGRLLASRDGCAVPVRLHRHDPMGGNRVRAGVSDLRRMRAPLSSRRDGRGADVAPSRPAAIGSVGRRTPSQSRSALYVLELYRISCGDGAVMNRELCQQLRAAGREVRDLETAIAKYPNIDPARNPLPGQLEAARAHLASVREAIARPEQWHAPAVAIVDALLDWPGVTIPERVAGLLAETIAAALRLAAAIPEGEIP